MLNQEGWTVIVNSICNIDIGKIWFLEILKPVYSTIGSANLHTIIECLPKYLSNVEIKHHSKSHHNKSKQIDPNKTDSSDELGDFGIIIRIARILDLIKDNDQDTDTIDLWNHLFENMKYIYIEVQSSYDKQKLVLQALQDIIVNYSSGWPTELWEFVLEDVVLLVYEKSITKYIDHLVGFSTTKAREFKQRENVPAMQTPTFSFGGPAPAQPAKSEKGNKKQARRMKFDEESIKKFNEKGEPGHTSVPGFGMAPEETPKTFKPPQSSIEDQELCMFVMDIFNDAFVASELKNHKTALNLWILYVKLMTPLVSNASIDIFKGVLHTILFYLDSELSEYFFEKYDSVTLGLFEEINSLIQRKTDLILTVEVTELLIKVYKLVFTENNIKTTPQLLNPQNLNVTFHILRANLINSRPTMGLNAMRAENELKEDEKLIFDFIEFLGDLFKDNDDALKYYLSYLLNFINYDPDEPHFEMFIRRTFAIISEYITKDQYGPGILYDLVPDLYSKTSDIVNLRYHNNSCMSLVLSMKSNASLFETAEQPKAEIPSVPHFFKPNLQIEIPGDDEGENEEDTHITSQVEDKESDDEQADKSEPNVFLGQSKGAMKNIKHKINSSLRAIDEEESMLLSPSKLKGISTVSIASVQDQVLNKIMEILKETLLFDITKIEKHNKAVKDPVIKSSQNLDVQIINFIINSLLPHANKLGKKFEHTLVSIIDQGCSGYLDAMTTSGMSMFTTSSTLLGQSNSLSTYCFDNLFELCSYKPSKGELAYSKNNKKKAEKLEEIKRKIAKTTIPILLERCKDSLSKFLHEHGFTTMSMQRVEEGIFILKKLKDLEVYPNVVCDLVNDDENADSMPGKQWNEDQLDFRYHCLKGTKAHLFLMLPLFSDLITSREDMIKDPLKDIFIEIAKASAITSKTVLKSGKNANGELSLF